VTDQPTATGQLPTELLTTEDDRADFRSSVRRLLAERSTEADVRRWAEEPADQAGFDAGLWKQLAAEVGLAGLLVPDAHGGQGLSLVELAVAAEEVGRALLAGPFLSTAVLAPTALRAAGDDAADARLLPGIAEGRLLVAVALDGDVTATDGVLSGTASNVLDAQAADRLLVVAGDALFEVDARGPGVALQTRRSLDHTLRLSTVTLTGAPAVRVGGSFDATSTREAGAIAAAAQLVGVGDAALDIAVAYAKTREQFGRVIGSYQGVKHLCAAMYSQQALSRATVGAATRATLLAPETAGEKIAVAKAWTSGAAVQVVEDCIQVLGGIGFTWEHPAHLLLRRAKLLEALFGDARAHRAALAGRLGLAQTG
jgi:alkylation response protein AidB-like acyl-CoA dehydrogenase